LIQVNPSVNNLQMVKQPTLKLRLLPESSSSTWPGYRCCMLNKRPRHCWGGWR